MCRNIHKHIFIISDGANLYFVSLGYRQKLGEITYQASYNLVHY